MSEDISDRIATNLGKSLRAAAKEMQMEHGKLYFSGSVYEVRVMYEGTSNEKLIIRRRDGWDKPLVLGRVGNSRDYVEAKK